MDQRRRFRGKEATGTPKEGMLRQLAGRHLQQTGKGGARDWLMTPPEQRKLSTQPVKAAQGINVTDPEVFKGSDLLTSLLSMLGGQAGTFGVDLPAVQQQLFGLLGMVIPGMYGQTDPAVQRAMAGAPQFYRAQGSPTVYVQMPDGTFRAIGDPATFKAMGGQWGQVKGVKPGTFKGQSGQGITLGDVPGVLQQFERPTLEAQQLRTQRELRGLSAVPGAGQMPSYR